MFVSYIFENDIRLAPHSCNTSMNFDRVDLILKTLTRHQIVSFVRSEYKLDVEFILDYMNNAYKTLFTDLNRIKQNCFQPINYGINSNKSEFNPAVDSVQFTCAEHEPLEKSVFLNDSNAHFRVLANSDLFGESFAYSLTLNHLYSLKKLFWIKLERLETSLSVMKLYEMFARLKSVEENLADKIRANSERFLDFIQDQNNHFLRVSQKFLEFYCDKQNELKHLKNLFERAYEIDSKLKKSEQYTVISGKRGSGKTTQAFKLARLKLEQFPHLIVKLVDASCRANILFDLKRIARDLGFANCSTIEQFKRDWNNFRFKITKMILIFDNLKSSSDLDQLTEGFNANVSCLITSSDNFINRKLSFVSYFVDDFDKYDAKLFILKVMQKIEEKKKKKVSFFDNYTTLLEHMFSNEPKISPVRLNLLVHFYINYTSECQHVTLGELTSFTADNYAYLKETYADAFTFLLYLSFVDGSYLELGFLRRVYEALKFDSSFVRVFDYLVNVSFVVKISNETFRIHESVLSELCQIRSFTEYDKTKIAAIFMKCLTKSNSNELFFKQFNRFRQNGLIDLNYTHAMYASIQEADLLKEAITPKEEKEENLEKNKLEDDVLLMLDRLLLSLLNGSNLIQVKYANLKDIASKCHDTATKRVFLSKLDRMESESRNFFSLEPSKVQRLFDRVIHLINIVKPQSSTSNEFSNKSIEINQARSNSNQNVNFSTDVLFNHLPTLVFQISVLVHNVRLFGRETDGSCLGRELILLADQLGSSKEFEHDENVSDFCFKYKRVYESVVNDERGVLENMINAVSLMYESDLEIIKANVSQEVYAIKYKVKDVEYVYKYDKSRQVKFYIKLVEH